MRECEALVDLKQDAHMPRLIESAPRTERIDTFVDTLKRSITTLRSLGVDVTDRTSYHENKMYITVCFNGI